MTAQHKRDTKMEDLLKRAFADDLPPDVASGMRRRIERFRADKTNGEASSSSRAGLFRRSVWVALSVLMLVAGIVLQGAKSSSPLANRISALKAEFSSVTTTRR
jgi:hypothetical protein